MKIKVPGFMVKATRSVPLDGNINNHDGIATRILEAALRALAENPIVPTEEQMQEIVRSMPVGLGSVRATEFRYAEWQRIMFLEPAEKVSEEELKGMERAAALFESASFGNPCPSGLIRTKISELRKEGK